MPPALGPRPSGAGGLLRLDDLTDCIALLERLNAPAWLVRHHELVGEAAQELQHGLEGTAAFGIVDWNNVVVGAGVHDVGKVLHTREMSEPGSQHEAAGMRMLLELGCDPSVAVHCVAHADFESAERTIEQLMVALADKVWKGKRVDALEFRIAEFLALRTGQERWGTWQQLTEVVDEVANRADDRLRRSVVG